IPLQVVRIDNSTLRLQDWLRAEESRTVATFWCRKCTNDRVLESGQLSGTRLARLATLPNRWLPLVIRGSEFHRVLLCSEVQLGIWQLCRQWVNHVALSVQPAPALPACEKLTRVRLAIQPQTELQKPERVSVWHLRGEP